MEVRTDSIAFGRAHGTFPRSQSRTVTFPSNVRQAIALLTGADFGFSPRDDHHLGMVDIRVNSSVSGTNVIVTATLGVRDWSGDVDDDYEGTVYFAVVAEI
ncbi:MAG: hypothetical protein QOF89_1163 [Acidobacteriota bacterium]|jgi:hypothetical protein|nr:hypothetical protein [Acidobacteriota bacterium]